MKRERRYEDRVIQFGEGNFLRCFVDWIIDILNEKAGFDSGITVVRPINSDSLPLLDIQDGLYTAIIRGIDEKGEVVEDYRVIQSVNREIPVYENFEGYLKLAENEKIKWIFSNTTEAGITFDEKDRYEDTPQMTFPGKLTRLLHERYKIFKGSEKSGFIILPCELIDYNGEKLKEIVLRYAELWNLEQNFKKWLTESNTWCSTLVDRIVTGYPFAEKEELIEKMGYEDKFMVTGEYFYLFVIQGPKWLKEELKLDRVNLNIKIVDDIRPYKERKVGILNGAHTSMVPVAYLYGIDTVRESIEDKVVGRYIRDVIFEEIIPALDMEKEELISFAGSVIDRFRNPFIEHKLMSISLNSMSKFKSRVLPQILSYRNKYGKFPEKLIFSFASLIKFYEGKRGEEEIELSDDGYILDFYKEIWSKFTKNGSYMEIVEGVLGLEKLWDTDLNRIEGLKEKISYYLEIINKNGMKKALEVVVG